MRTWIKVSEGFVIGKMTSDRSPGPLWEEGVVKGKVLDSQGNPLYRMQSGKPVPVDSYKVNVLAWGAIRQKRNSLLSASDWTQFPDSPLSTQKKNKWKTYRQALRDIPDNFSDPEDVIFPRSPDEETG